jgi:hypothetical protein
MSVVTILSGSVSIVRLKSIKKVRISRIHPKAENN